MQDGPELSTARARLQLTCCFAALELATARQFVLTWDATWRVDQLAPGPAPAALARVCALS